ncbi:cyclin-dependent kinase 1-like isoform X2 [Babylonia areolata]
MTDDTDGIPVTSIREIMVLKELKHHNIVKLEGVITEYDRLFLVFEYMNMDLKHYISTVLPPGEMVDRKLIKSYMFQIVSGLLFCHQRRIIHRDLKPQNLLIDSEGSIKIADFGMARALAFQVGALTHKVVTLWYRAPEILMGDTVYSTPVDIWSIGVIFAELFSRRELFKGDSEIGQLFAIFRILGTPTNDRWPDMYKLPGYNASFPEWKFILHTHLKEIDALGLDLLKCTLLYDPKKRIHCKVMLHHPYFADVDLSVKPASLEPSDNSSEVSS